MTAQAKPSQAAEVVENRIRLCMHMLSLGAWVFPLQHNGKQPFTPKKAGGSGFLDAKPDPELARTFLSNPGQLNYGLAFPEGSDIIVLDLDGGDKEARPNWREDWQALYDRYGPPGLTYIVRTPSGGRHAYYRWRSDLYGPMNDSDEMLGWTVRKPWKGYLVGPGSVINGLVYEPAGVDHIADLPEPWARAAVAEMQGKTRPTPTTGARLTIKGPGAIQAGHRHKYLRDQARHLVGLGLTGKALETAVLDLNRQLPQPKTSEEVLRAIGEAESKFEADEIAEDGTVAGRRPSRIYAEDVELAMPAVHPFPEDPDPGVFAGIAGEAVDSLSLVTSASKIGMLTALLAAWGGLFGTRTTYHGDQPSLLFTVLVGETGRARKGTTTSAVWTALDHAMAAQDSVGQTFQGITVSLSTNRWDGLASGEALVRILNEAKQGVTTYPVYGLIVEEEFERLLRRMRSSDGYQSTLDVYLRQAFDARMIQHITASKTVKVQPPYGVSILGNVTRETLRQVVSPDMARSGFANRFLWTPIEERNIEVQGSDPWHFADGIGKTLSEARRAWIGGSHVALTDDALSVLNDYGAHLRSLSGLSGAMSARLHVIASRIALVHAGIERAASIGRAFVERAIALTEYARSGLSWSFREDVGDEDANVLFSAVCGRFPDGLSTREARAVVTRSGRFLAARDLLLEAGLITSTNPNKPSTKGPQTEINPEAGSRGGRPSVMLYATEPTTFQRFVVREGCIESDSHHTPPNRPLTPTERESGDHKPSTKGPQTPEADSEVVVPPVDVAAVWAQPCHFYREHQQKHRQTPDGWICDICWED